MRPVTGALLASRAPAAQAAAGRNLYWVGGTASWDATAGSKWALTSGGTGGETVPTTIDNVFIDGNSGAVTVTLASTGACADLTFTGFTGTFAGSSGISIYGSLTLATGMTRTYTGSISFTATSTGKTITCSGKTLASIVSFSGVGGGWTHQDDFTTSSSYNHTSGALDTNGKAISCTNFNGTGALTRSLTLGSSTITISSSLGFDTTTNLTLSAASSTVNLTGDTSEFRSGNVTWGTINYTSNNPDTVILQSTASPGATIGTLTSNARTGNCTISIIGDFTISTALTFAGANANTQRLGVIAIGEANSTITCNGVATLTNVDFAGVTGAGSATWTGTSVGDCGGNSGITFTGAVTRYLVTAAGSNDFMADIWSTSSGGATGASRPIPQDTVVVDGSSFASGSRTLVVGGYRLPALDFTGATNTPAISMAATTVLTRIFYDFKLISGVTVSGSSTIEFNKRSGTQTLTMAGKSFVSPVVFRLKPAATIALGDAYANTSSTTLTTGTFADGNFNVTSLQFIVSGTGTRSMAKGTGTYTLTGTTNAWNATTVTNLTFSDTGTIKYTNNSTTAKTMATGGLTYNNLWNATLGTGTFTQSGSNATFADIKIDAARTHRFTANTTTNLATLTASGTLGNLTVITSATAANHTLNFTALPIALTFMNISRSTATGAAASATASTDGGNNINWTIAA